MRAAAHRYASPAVPCIPGSAARHALPCDGVAVSLKCLWHALGMHYKKGHREIRTLGGAPRDDPASTATGSTPLEDALPLPARACTGVRRCMTANPHAGGTCGSEEWRNASTDTRDAKLIPAVQRCCFFSSLALVGASLRRHYPHQVRSKRLLPLSLGWLPLSCVFTVANNPPRRIRGVWQAPRKPAIATSGTACPDAPSPQRPIIHALPARSATHTRVRAIVEA